MSNHHDKPIVGFGCETPPRHHWLRMLRYERVLVDQENEPERTHWEVNPKGKLPWLQGLLLAALKRLGANTFNWKPQQEVLRALDIQPQGFLQALCGQLDNIDAMFDHRPSVLYIGKKQFLDAQRLSASKLPHHTDADVPFWFQAEYRAGRAELYGLRVNVVPWFDGVLAL